MQTIYRNDGLIELFLWILISAVIIPSVLAECGHLEWQCDDGDCITDHLACDGTTDCKDLSDEIAQNCIHHKCPRFAFTCSYGACIPGIYRCNNATDCADNSDEFVCSNSEPSHHQGECGADKMQCLSLNRQCIDRDVMCDGSKDCSDGSDETVEVCAGLKCTPWQFKCGYGACVTANAKCNGIVECADGSDEAWQLCGTARMSRTAIPSTPQSLPTYEYNVTKSIEEDHEPETIYQDYSEEEDEGKICTLPLDRPDLNFKLHPQNHTVKPGSEVDEWDIVHVECLNGANFATSILCRDGKFASPFPKCQFCDKQKIEGISTRSEIVLNGSRIDPSVYPEGIPVGSVVDVTCRPGFKNREKSQRIECLQNGTFSRKRKSCELDCGTRLAFDGPSLPNGIQIKQSIAPWHAGIYKKDTFGKFHKICGATILSPSIVVSAAHCFPPNSNMLGLGNYSIVAGKSFRVYDSINDTAAQFRQAKNVHIPNRYNKTTYYKDISVINLESPLLFDEMTSAACPPIETKHLKSGFHIANFNKETTKLSYHVLTRTSRHNCKRRNRGNELTVDQFCLTISGTHRLCHDQSGNGIIEKYKGKFHIAGVLSHICGGNNNCVRTGGHVAVTNTIDPVEEIFHQKVHKGILEDKKLF